MVFNKKSMSVTSKLNECVKTQEKQIAELKWTNGMHENELKEKSLKIEALQVRNSAVILNSLLLIRHSWPKLLSMSLHLLSLHRHSQQSLQQRSSRPDPDLVSHHD